MWYLGSSWEQKQQEWTDSRYIEKRELGDGGTWRVRKRDEEMTTPLGEGWRCSQKRAIQEEEQIWGKDRLGFLDKLGVPRCWNDWQFIKKECFDLKRKVMIRNTDVSVIEALEVSGAVKGGLVSRENLRAEDESLREVDSEWLRERNPSSSPLYPVITPRRPSSILRLTSFDSSSRPTWDILYSSELILPCLRWLLFLRALTARCTPLS